VRVAIIDSGWDATTADDRVDSGVALVDAAGRPTRATTDDVMDRNGHGTMCANIVLQWAPAARIVPLRVFGRRLETSPEAICAALDEAVARRVDLVNLSLGTVRRDAGPPLYEACARATDAGVLIIAAGHVHARFSYPASFDIVIGVGQGQGDSPFDYDYLPGALYECRAPGTLVPTRSLGGEPRVVTGTSFASAALTATVTMFLERRPRSSIATIRGMLHRYARSVVPGWWEQQRVTRGKP
jgi:subtilisin family serine protease